MAACARASDISASGTSDGVHGSVITQSGVTRSAGTSPARTSEDLPLPDGPSTGMMAPSRLRLGRVDELAELVDLAVSAEEHRGVRLVEGAQPGVRRAGRVPPRLLVEAEGGERRADLVGVDGVGGDVQPLQVRGERVRRAAVDQQRQDRLAQPAGQRQLGVAPLAGVRLRRGDEDDRVARVEVREQLVAPGLPGDQPAGGVEVEEDRLVAEVGQGVLHLRRELVVGGGVGHEDLRHGSPPRSAWRRPAWRPGNHHRSGDACEDEMV